MAVVIASNEAN